MRRIGSGVVRMSTLVEDLPLLARVDAGRPPVCEEAGLGPPAAEAVSDARAAGSDHQWRIELPHDPAVVTGDQTPLHQVMADLLSNAYPHPARDDRDGLGRRGERPSGQHDGEQHTGRNRVHRRTAAGLADLVVYVPNLYR